MQSMPRLFIALSLVLSLPCLAPSHLEAQRPILSEVEVVESYDAAFGELPEGVAVHPKTGEIFVGIAPTGEIRRLDPKTYAGESLAFLDVGGGFLLGMAYADAIYVAVASFDPSTCGIWRIGEDGSTARVVAFGGQEFPNDLTFDKTGRLYITESISGSVWVADPVTGGRELWIQDVLLVGDPEQSPVPFPIGANGIAYDDERDVLLVANSQVPAIVEIENHFGTAGALTVLAAGEHLRGADGIALDRQGDVLVVSNFNSTVLHLDRASGAATVLADGEDGLVFPATGAFGQFGNDKHSFFVTNFGFGASPDAPVGLLKVDVGVKSEKCPAGN